jgi:sulfate adenylyltransferase
MSLRQEMKGNLTQSNSGATAATAQVTRSLAPMGQLRSPAIAPRRQSLAGGVAIFLTGLSGAGKTTIARELGARFAALGQRVTMLDGDDLRARVSPDLGFSQSDREANLRRAAMIAAEVVKHGGITICSFIAPYEQSRREIREMVQEQGRFFLVHVSTPLEECERRDPKGLYRKARAGVITGFTGISDVYEIPTFCELTIDTSRLTAPDTTDRILRGLASTGLPATLWLAAGLRVAFNGGPESNHCDAPNCVSESRRLSLFHSILEVTAQRRVALDEVSRTVGAERHTIETIVRSVTGQNFRELQRRLLLERSNALLQQGKMIKEVAFELGFGTPQSFHRFIRRASGKTPVSLRKSA